MRKLLSVLFVLLCFPFGANAQYDQVRSLDDDQQTAPGYEQNRQRGSDSIQSQHKEVPRGLKVWTIDERFGDRRAAVPDTLSFMFMNSIFTTGKYGEYNSLGNLGSPRQARVFTDRQALPDFFFMAPYDYFLVEPSQFHFTSTLSPFTLLSYNTAGDRLTGEDHFKAYFAVNAGKRWGFGFKFDYLYGRGYYDSQATSHFNYTMWGSYLGERYQAHLLLSTNHQKVTENGGIANDAYITHPEMFNESFASDEIPTVLQQNWNRYDNQHVFFNHRYSLGFYRNVPMTEEEIQARQFAIRSEQANAAEKEKEKARRKAAREGDTFDEKTYDRQHRPSGRPVNGRIAGDVPAHTVAGTDTTRVQIDLQQGGIEAALAQQDSLQTPAVEWTKREYVPVTSFIHSVRFDNWRRIYQAYQTPVDFYAHDFYTPQTFTGDSIYDQSKSWTLKNTFAVALLEGFNKWAKAGLKAFVSLDLKHFELPNVLESADGQAFSNGLMGWSVHNLTVGGQLLKTLGRAFHYDVSAEAWVEGDESGQFKVDGHADYNIPLLGDTARVDVSAFFHNTIAPQLLRTYRSRHFSWDNSGLDKTSHSHVMGALTLQKTGTTLRAGYDMLKNYVYLGLQNQRVADGDNFLTKGLDVQVRQHGGSVGIFTAQLQQRIQWGILHWDTRLTYQKSSNEDVIALPALNVYTNLFLRFKIARVLQCDFGGDVRWFSKYYAPEYIPGLSAFGVQETAESRTKVGGYPVANVYANFLLKHTRFFVMMSHVNAGSGGEYFLTPHYPLNGRIFRFGISWNFFN